MDARYRTSGHTGYVLLGFDGKEGNHLHIEVASPDYFGRKRPKPSHRISEVRDVLEKLNGEEIDVGIVGRYRLAQGDSPPVIRSMIVETSEGELSLKTVGGELLVTGAPIDMIRWWVPGERSEFRIELRTNKTLEINEHYLENCLKILDPVFEALFGSE
jgi:hypothetical protein